MSTNKRTLILYWKQIRKYKSTFFIGLFFIPIASLAIDTILPFFLSQAIGNLSSNNNSLIIQNIIISIIVVIIGVMLNFFGFRSILRHEADVRFELARETFIKLIHNDLSFFANEKIGALTSRYIDFIRSHVDLQDLFVIRTMSFIISVGGGIIIVGIQSPLLSLILALLILAIIIQVKYSFKYREPYRFARKNLIAESNGKVADSLTNSLIVKTFANEKIELKNIDEVNDAYRTAYVKDFRLMSLEGSLRILAMSAIQIISIGICTLLVSSGKMSIPVAIFILVYLQRISAQLFFLGDILNGYDKQFLAAAPMSDILAIDPGVIDKPNAINIKIINPTINFIDISYRYSDNKDNVLEKLNLSIAAGEKIGLVGHSGAGKTTITHLLLRFADVTNGSIQIDGHDIRDITQKSLRKNIAYVPQEPMLFHRTLRENIAYGKPNATDDEIWDAVEKANASEFIKNIPEGLDAIVGERGIKLSGGQRQRVAIARAILKNAPILVLDEATSALDSESEKLIQDALSKLMKGRTSIVIAHRLSTIAKLDRIIVIDKGIISEQGTHNELLEINGIYAKLWQHQSGGFIDRPLS